jgi:hypothetical protein
MFLDFKLIYFLLGYFASYACNSNNFFVDIKYWGELKFPPFLNASFAFPNFPGSWQLIFRTSVSFSLRVLSKGLGQGSMLVLPSI